MLATGLAVIRGAGFVERVFVKEEVHGFGGVDRLTKTLGSVTDLSVELLMTFALVVVLVVAASGWSWL